MLKEIEQQLINIFGERVAFHNIELLMYSSDLASLPTLITNRIKTMPDAVVLPETKEELVNLLDLAGKYKIPLVPRGAASSGYGGAVPTKGGIVVDFSRMNKILSIDKENKTVIVEPGVIWNDLEKELQANGLALRLYPGSALSATVGGWIANGGGIGIGSFEFGFIGDNIIDIELVTPAGIRNIDKESIDIIEAMAGTTGFISRISLPVRDSEKDIPVVAAFSNFDNLITTFNNISDEKLPLWEVGYKDKLNVELTRSAIEKQALKGPVPHKVHTPLLPEKSYIASFVYPESREETVNNKLPEIIHKHDGEVLSQELADHEWSERFYGMRLKALGPSIIPAEVVIPTDKLPEFVKEISTKVNGLAFNGTLVNGGKEAAFLGYKLEDERRRGYAFSFVNSLIPLNVAVKFGGRPYVTGMLLTNYASVILDQERLDRAFKFKKEVDPNGIMNPGKVFPAFMDKDTPIRTISLLNKLATSQMGLINVVDSILGGKPSGMSLKTSTPLRNLPFSKELAWDAFACTNCGYCRSDCTEFNAIGWESSSPRGKFHFIREYIKGNIEFDERMGEIFFICTTCRRCNEACQVMASIDEHWSFTVRPLLWQQGFNPPAVHQDGAHNIAASHNPGGYPQSERKDWMPPDIKYHDEGEIAYFAGCSSSFNASTRNIAVNTMRLLNKAGIEPAYLGDNEWCCGGSMYLMGCLDEAMETIEYNLKEFEKRGIKKIITSCSGCWIHLSHFYPVLARDTGYNFPDTIKHVTQILNELIDEEKLKCKFPVNLEVTYHDPCHIGRGGGIYDEPRKILAAIPELKLIEMSRIKSEATCCGRHVMRYPRLGLTMHNDRLNEVKETGVHVLVGACPTCETNFRLGITESGADLEVFDITDLVCHSVGLPTVVMSRLMKLGVM